MTINAPGANVVLRGLLLRGTAALSFGVQIVAAASVQVVDCAIQNFLLFGIRTDASGSKLFISDTIVRNNGLGGGPQGGLLVGAGASSQLTIENSRFENNGEDGISVAGPTETTISGVVVSGNGGNGISSLGGRMNVTSTVSAGNGVSGYLASNSEITADSSVARGNGNAGLRTQGTGTARAGNSVFTNNAFGLQNAGGTLLSRGNNLVSGNGTDTSGTITPLGGV